MHLSTIGVATEDVCPTCGRAGHYSDAIHPETLVYEKAPQTAHDFNQTWEYFGNWQQVRNMSNSSLVGGCRGVIVSQTVRQVFRQLNVRRLVWVPVTILKQKSMRRSVGEGRTGPPNTPLEQTAGKRGRSTTS
jgi:hypothetical protein